MRRGNELEKNGTVHGLIAAGPKTCPWGTNVSLLLVAVDFSDKPMKAQRVAIATKLGLPAPTRPAIAAMRRVMLKARRRPIKSAVIGHPLDPNTSPAYFPTVRNAICLTLNSLMMGGLMMVMACIQNYSVVRAIRPMNGGSHIVDKPSKSRRGIYFPLEATHPEINQSLIHKTNLLLVHLIRTRLDQLRIDALVIDMSANVIFLAGADVLDRDRLAFFISRDVFHGHCSVVKRSEQLRCARNLTDIPAALSMTGGVNQCAHGSIPRATLMSSTQKELPALGLIAGVAQRQQYSSLGRRTGRVCEGTETDRAKQAQHSSGWNMPVVGLEPRGDFARFESPLSGIAWVSELEINLGLGCPHGGFNNQMELQQ